MSLAGFTHIGDYTLPTLAGTHTDFPVVLRYADFGAGVLSQLKADGGDLRFSTSADVQIAAHVKTFNPATNDILVHVCVPSASTGEVIKIWGNNAGASALPATDPYGQYAAYVGWLFFSHDGTSDDTGDLIFTGSGTPDTSPFSGQATDFDGVADGYFAVYSGGGQASGANWTFSALVRPDAIPSLDSGDIVSTHRDTASSRGFILGLGTDGKLLVIDRHTASVTFSGATTLQTNGTWYQVGAVKRGRSGLRDLYLDGVADAPATGGDMGTQYSTNTHVSIGKRRDSNFFNGAIAHVGARFGRAESAEWFSDHTSNLTAAGAWGIMTSTGGSGSSQPITLIAAIQGETAQAVPITQSALTAAVQAAQAETAASVAIEQIAAQAVNSVAALQGETAQTLNATQRLQLATVIAQQLETAQVSGITSIQAITFVTATQNEIASAISINQTDGQLITIIDAVQAETAQSYLISQTSFAQLSQASQNEIASSSSITQLQPLIAVNAEQIELAEIINIICSGDATDLSGLVLVPVTEIYSLTEINKVTYSIEEI